MAGVKPCPQCGQPLIFTEAGFANPGGSFCTRCGIYAYDLEGKRLPSASTASTAANQYRGE